MRKWLFFIAPHVGLNSGGSRTLGALQGYSYSYTYDGGGNRATGDAVSIAYDVESRMTSASGSASAFSDSESYNGLDQRVSKADSSGRIRIYSR